MNNIDLTPIFNAIVALIAAVTSCFVIPWLKSHLTASQREELMEWAKIAVAAAEQIYGGQGRGEEKKEYVLAFLESKGFTFDAETINNAIEAAVNQLNCEALLV